MVRRVLVAAVVSLAIVLSAKAALPAEAQTSTMVGTHKLIVAVKNTMATAAERRLAVLVLVSQNGGAPAGSLATPSKPMTVLQQNGGLYSVKAEIDSACRGNCDAPSYRNFRLGRSQTRGRRRLSADGLRLLLQQGQDRQGVLNSGVRPGDFNRSIG
jgi:hypothetical protein